MKKLIFIALATLLVGCKTVEPLFYHGNHNENVYNYFKADEVTLEEQIQSMNELLASANEAGKMVAPGIHAHLAMLYFEVGNSSDGIKHFEAEKQLYPESTQYIDFLMTAAMGGNNEAH